MSAKILIIVFISGGIGSLARYLLSFFNNSSGNSIPWGTLGANFLACFIAGCAAGFFLNKPEIKPELRLGILTGFCGGFSTFSTFSLESVQLFQGGYVGLAALYIFLSLLFCVSGILAGFISGKAMG